MGREGDAVEMKPGLEFSVCSQTGPSQQAALCFSSASIYQAPTKNRLWWGLQGLQEIQKRKSSWEGPSQSPEPKVRGTKRPSASSPPSTFQLRGGQRGGGQRGGVPGTERKARTWGWDPPHPTLAPSLAPLEGGKG